MEIRGEALLHALPDEVWAAINDPEVLARCVPGCQRLEPSGDSRYTAALELGVGAIKGRYEGEVALLDQVPPSFCRIKANAQGLPGHVDANGTMSLEAVGDQTRLSYAVEAQVGGKLAGVGQRVLGGIAKLLAGRFFSSLDRELRPVESKSAEEWRS